MNFSVEEVFRGDSARDLSVRVTKFGGSCGFEFTPGELYFKKGEKYLVYADYAGALVGDKPNADVHLRTNHCTETTLASNATEKINAYRKLSRLQRPLVLGTYNIQTASKQTPALAQSVTIVPMSGGTRLNAPVHADGSFLLTGVLPTTYTLAPTITKGYRVGFGGGYRIGDHVPVNPKTINVEKDSCTELEVVALPEEKSNGRPARQ